MPYTMQWSAANPGCLILLLDRSGSMSNKFGGKSLAAGEALMDQVAVVVNNTIRRDSPTCRCSHNWIWRGRRGERATTFTRGTRHRIDF